MRGDRLIWCLTSMPYTRTITPLLRFGVGEKEENRPISTSGVPSGGGFASHPGLEGRVTPLIQFPGSQSGSIRPGPGFQKSGPRPDGDEMNRPVGVGPHWHRIWVRGLHCEPGSHFPLAASPLLGIPVWSRSASAPPWGWQASSGPWSWWSAGHVGGPEPGLHWAPPPRPSSAPASAKPSTIAAGPSRLGGLGGSATDEARSCSGLADNRKRRLMCQ